jgi:hypothetical protein
LKLVREAAAMRYLLIPVVLVLLLVGCGSRNGSPSEATRPAPAGAAPKADRQQDAPKQQAAGDKEPAGFLRKIKQTADIGLITEDFPTVERQIKELVRKHHGHVARSEVTGSPGSTRQGTWRVRIPVESFDAFCDAVLVLGEVERNTSDSEEVTEEYYDLENHVKNKQAEIEGLRKLMEKSGDKMDNLLAVRREINQVQDDVQRKQGRLKLLANLTDLTTVSITVRERQKYVPDKGPEVAEIPTFAMRALKTFGDSLGAVKSLAAEVAIVLIALAPWLPLLLVLGIPTWIFARRRARAWWEQLAAQGRT